MSEKTVKKKQHRANKSQSGPFLQRKGKSAQAEAEAEGTPFISPKHTQREEWKVKRRSQPKVQPVPSLDEWTLDMLKDGTTLKKTTSHILRIFDVALSTEDRAVLLKDKQFKRKLRGLKHRRTITKETYNAFLSLLRRPKEPPHGSSFTGASSEGATPSNVDEGVNEKQVELGKEHFILRASKRAELRSLSEIIKGDEQFSGWIAVERGVNLELLDSKGDWIEVQGQTIELSFGHSTKTAGFRRGWIQRDETTLDRRTDMKSENDKVGDDLTALRGKIDTAVDAWENGVRIQGQAYLDAYIEFNDVLTNAERQAKARADLYAAVLTTVSVGALGWIGEAAKNSKSLGVIFNSSPSISKHAPAFMKSAGFHGSLEDALQTGIGETVDIKQGGWFTQNVNKETQPLGYLNGALIALTSTKIELGNFMDAKVQEVENAIEPLDRTSRLVKMYTWWDTALVRHTPNVTQSSQLQMQREFERGFWVEYIKNDLITRGRMRQDKLQYWDPNVVFGHPEDAVKDALDKLSISSDAEIGDWESWYHLTDWEGPRKWSGKELAEGSLWTQELYVWATTKYKPITFS